MPEENMAESLTARARAGMEVRDINRGRKKRAEANVT